MSKKWLLECCWSHGASAQSRVPGTLLNWTSLYLDFFCHFLPRLIRIKRSQVMSIGKYGPQHSILARIYGLQQHSESHFWDTLYKTGQVWNLMNDQSPVQRLQRIHNADICRTKLIKLWILYCLLTLMLSAWRREAWLPLILSAGWEKSQQQNM